MKLQSVWFVFAFSLLLNWSAVAQEKTQVKAKQATAKDNVQQSAEDEDLQRAIQEARGSQQQVIENLDAYLKKHPSAVRREEIQRTVYKLASEMHDRNRQIEYAEQLVAADGNDIEMLTNLVSDFRERKGAGDLAKALTYADKLVKVMEQFLSSRTKPAKVSPGNWELQKSRALASVYFLRGQVENDLGQPEKAEPDLQKSYKHAPLAATAVLLSDLAERRKSNDQAIEYLMQAFVRSLEGAKNPEAVDRTTIRQKLGRLYSAQHGSEKGLGDQLLKAYDTLSKEDTERAAKYELPNPNENVSDPLQFKLTKLNGGDIKLADYKGKVIVVNFWATWCGPCRVEMPELERAMIKYKEDREVVFLAVNTDDDRNYVEPYVKGQKIKLPVVYANYLDNYFGVSSIPTTMIFDKTGEIAFRQAGFNSNSDFVVMLSEKIEALKKK